MLIHHVFFWMSPDATENDKALLRAGLERMTSIDLIKQSHIGVPAPTNRPVIDNTYTFSWLTVFETSADELAYQTHPAHLQFIDSCKHLWTRVLVYDSI
jgi:hypothetical protein